MTHCPKRTGMRPRMLALAMVALLAAGQAAGCASYDAEGEVAGSGLFGTDDEVLVAGIAILSVVAAALATSSESD